MSTLDLQSDTSCSIVRMYFSLLIMLCKDFICMYPVEQVVQIYC